MSDEAALAVPAPEYQFGWTQASTIASGAGALTIILTIGTLIYDRIRRGKLADPLHFATRKADMGYFWIKRKSWWAAFWKKKTPTPKITTVRGLIQAGDENLWSSAAFDQIEPYHGEISWMPIYSAIYSQIAKEIANVVDSHASKYLERARREKDSMNASGQYRRELIDDGILVCCIRRLDEAQVNPKNQPEGPPPTPQRSPSRIDSFKDRMVGRTASIYTVAAPGKSLNNSEYIWMRSGKPCIELSREELLALSLTLGITLHINDYTQNVRGSGPFGTGFNIVQDNGEWKLDTVYGARLIRHKTSRGSGYTSLFAKHIAFGSLPFADSIKEWVKSVYVNDRVLEAIKRGDSIIDGYSFGGRPLQILRRLPGLKQIDAYYHSATKDRMILDGKKLEPDEKLDLDVQDHQLGRFYKKDKKTPIEIKDGEATKTKGLPNTSKINGASNSETNSSEDKKYANWTRAVAGIAFGGLVPQSSINLAEAVQFTVDELENLDKPEEKAKEDHERRVKVEELVNKIEDLINQIQGWASRRAIHTERQLENSEKPFGDYVAERAPSEKAVDNVYYAIPLEYHDTQEAAASFARYMNLLEWMVASYLPKDEEANNSAPKKCSTWSNYMAGAWGTKKKEPFNGLKHNNDRVNTVFEKSCENLQSVYTRAVWYYRGRTGLGNESETALPNYRPPLTLNEEVQNISNKVSKARRDFIELVNSQAVWGKVEKNKKPEPKLPDGNDLLAITLQDCVLIVRCILIIWSNQVPKIHNADTSESHPWLQSGESRTAKTNHPASLMDLPQVMAFA
ncbi:hypothetical protein B7494_g6705 [Chlorociboria aeruginascens]|nr:hypothetical protein B7494_g6705 [Chlorociboria aeruginascens]